MSIQKTNETEQDSFTLSTKIFIADSNKSKFKELIDELNNLKFVVKHCNDRHTTVKLGIYFKPDILLINLFHGNASTVSVIRELGGVLSDKGSKVIVLTQHYSKQNTQ